MSLTARNLGLLANLYSQHFGCALATVAGDVPILVCACGRVLRRPSMRKLAFG
jgi:hypothetical protein